MSDGGREDVLVELASERVGGSVVGASDAFFAPAERLVLEAPPIFDPERYTDRGKWMDGWETRRRRRPGPDDHDWAVIRLGIAGIVRRVVVDTSHFTGNHPAEAALDGSGSLPRESDDPWDLPWHELAPRRALEGDAHNVVEIDDPHRVTHVRLRIYPDGGVARLRVLGIPLPGHDDLCADHRLPDLVGRRVGGTVTAASDGYFGGPGAILRPTRPVGMFDGWETRRRRDAGNDWVRLRLGVPGRPERLLVDTSYFKGNAPGLVSLAGRSGDRWQELLPAVPVRPDDVAMFELTEVDGVVEEVELRTHPDGGVARIRLYGRPDRDAVVALRLRYLDALYPEEAERFFATVTGSTRFAVEMVGRRPFPSVDAVEAAVVEMVASLSDDELIEALDAHPRIGERHGGRQDATGAALSAGEQAAVIGGPGRHLEELAELNAAYEDRFGFRFVIDAQGRGPSEIVEALRRRLERTRAEELETARAAQLAIARSRLRRMLCAG